MGVLFVCTGNICRSPTAQGVFEQLLREQGLARHFLVDSAGVSGSHAGQAPDPRTQQAAKARGIDLSKQRARKIKLDDFRQFDYLIAMDEGHHEQLLSMRPEDDEVRATLHRLLEFAPALALTDVPDPYYGPLNGFQRVFDIVDAGCRGLLLELKQRHRL
nr:low molecular weight protein-tyrosine-phosphatase [Permianibacter fluminis]